MPVKAIIEKIRADAEKEAEEILESYRKKVADIEVRKSREIDIIRSDAEKKGKNQAEESVRRMFSSTQMESRQSLLELKQKLIDEAFREAYDQVKNLKPQEYVRFLGSLLEQVAVTGDEEVVVAKSDAKKLSALLIESVNRNLKISGKQGKISLARETIDSDGGFVLRRGRKEINATLSVLFGNAREELESEVAGILFGEQQ
jgi:V/A-type H+-transporting ATPase subunit E